MEETPDIRAEVCLPTTDLTADLAFFGRVLGMQLDTIFPADDPAVAVLSGHGLRVRLDRRLDALPGRVRLLTDDAGFAGGPGTLTAPGGCSVEVAHLTQPVVLPPTRHAFVVQRLADQAPWVIGRAGMHYRDLVPDRLGGSIIASHIRIPDGGPVPDMVHYHEVGFQLIFCIAGWVDVVYEDQGPPIRLTRGDCFIQPPGIRHRVLQASDGIEVIEIGVPAEHVTRIDHDMTLPTPRLCPERTWDGQRFVFDRAEGATWQPFRVPGYVARDTGIDVGTGGVATVQVVAKGQGPLRPTRHDADILFGFVMSGGMVLTAEGHGPVQLHPGDAYVIPPGLATRWGDPTDDLELLEVALPGRFATTVLEATSTPSSP